MTELKKLINYKEKSPGFTARLFYVVYLHPVSLFLSFEDQTTMPLAATHNVS